MSKQLIPADVAGKALVFPYAILEIKLANKESCPAWLKVHQVAFTDTAASPAACAVLSVLSFDVPCSSLQAAASSSTPSRAE
jgi:hypothetical protein